MKRPISPILSRRSPPSHVRRRLRSWSVRKAALPRTSARRCLNYRMWCGSRSARASCVPTPPQLPRSRWFKPRSATGGEGWHFAVVCQDEGWLMNLARAVVTNETDIVAIDAVDAGDFGETTPACAVICGDVAVDRLDIGRIGKDAADVVASHCRTWAGEFRAPGHGLGAGTEASGQGRQDQNERDHDIANH